MEEFFPKTTFILLLIILSVYLFSRLNVDFVLNNFGLVPNRVLFQPHTILTHIFIHVDPIHFLGNVFMLALLGLLIEDKIGSINLFLIFLFSGLIVVPFVYFLTSALSLGNVVFIGSSGAIFGLIFIGALLAGERQVMAILVPVLNIFSIPFYLFLKSPKVPFWIAIIFYLGLNIVMMFLNFPDSIIEIAHFVGLFGGFIGFFILARKKK